MTESQASIDQALVVRVQRGEKSAFDLLVKKYQYRIASLVSRFVHDSAEVEDVVQEVFIKAYRAIGRFRGDSAFYTWIYRIAVNTSKNYLLAQGRRPPGQDLDPVDVENMESNRKMRDMDTPDSIFLSKNVADTVKRTIEALPEEHRQAILLRELEGLSYEEIADAMECPIGTVRSRIFRAREAIEKALQEVI